MKEILWNPRAKEFVQSLDINTKREIGTLLMLIQLGQFLNEPQSKPMKAIHKNAYELRIKDKNGAYRIIYILNIGNKIFIPHAFTKTTNRTPKKEILISIKRFQELLNEN